MTCVMVRLTYLLSIVRRCDAIRMLCIKTAAGSFKKSNSKICETTRPTWPMSNRGRAQAPINRHLWPEHWCVACMHGATHTARLTFLSCQRPYTRARPPLSRALPSRPRSCVAGCNERCFRGGHAVVGICVLHTTPSDAQIECRPQNCVILDSTVRPL
jgi:hypothetical protein